MARHWGGGQLLARIRAMAAQVGDEHGVALLLQRLGEADPLQLLEGLLPVLARSAGALVVDEHDHGRVELALGRVERRGERGAVAAGDLELVIVRPRRRRGRHRGVGLGLGGGIRVRAGLGGAGVLVQGVGGRWADSSSAAPRRGRPVRGPCPWRASPSRPYRPCPYPCPGSWRRPPWGRARGRGLAQGQAEGERHRRRQRQRQAHGRERDRRMTPPPIAEPRPNPPRPVPAPLSIHAKGCRGTRTSGVGARRTPPARLLQSGRTDPAARGRGHADRVSKTRRRSCSPSAAS